MGHINHARYLSYLEDARMELLSTSPSGLAGAADGDRGYIAGRLSIDYRHPAMYRPGLVLRVETWVSRIGTKSWTFAHRLLDADTVVAESECVVVAYSYLDAKARPLDPDERAFWEMYLR
jgi:acyl-CoA thioester hydrolase